MLVQIDRLVQLLETPIFTYLRLQLLQPARYPDLVRCLNALLLFVSIKLKPPGQVGRVQFWKKSSCWLPAYHVLPDLGMLCYS